MYSYDGGDFKPVPQDPGTVLGDLGAGHNGIRSMAIYRDRLYVSIGKLRGEGKLYEADQPIGGNNNFRLVSPPRMQVYEMCVYNGYLYCGLTADETMEGFYVVKTDASGEPPYEFNPVVKQGGYQSSLPSNSVVSMYVYKNRLYVGTDKPAEIVRINPDDTWDLIVGAPRNTPEGYKYPLSGMYSGFNWPLNEHIWRMQEHEGWLYISTNDMTSLNMKNWPIMDWPVIGDLLTTFQGGDLLATRDGLYYTVIDRAGFGDGLDIGIRTFASTSYGLFCGTSNPYYGCRVWRGEYQRIPNEPTPPQRIEAEITDDAVLLSWDYARRDTRFRIFRAIGSDPPTEIGTTEDFFFADKTEDHSNNAYYVIVENLQGTTSRPSNTYYLPSAAPPMTLSELYDIMTGYGQRGKFESPEAEQWFLDSLDTVREFVRDGSVDDAERLLRSMQERAAKNEKVDSQLPILQPYCAEDLDLFLSKLLKRVRLVKAGLLNCDNLQ